MKFDIENKPLTVVVAAAVGLIAAYTVIAVLAVGAISAVLWVVKALFF